MAICKTRVWQVNWECAWTALPWPVPTTGGILVRSADRPLFSGHLSTCNESPWGSLPTGNGPYKPSTANPTDPGLFVWIV